MKKFGQRVKSLIKIRYYRWSFYGWLVMLGIQISVLLIKWQKLPPEIPFFYSLPWGEDQLVSPHYLTIFPASSVIFFFINSMLAVFAFPREMPISVTLIVVSLLLTLIATIGLIKIVFLVT